VFVPRFSSPWGWPYHLPLNLGQTSKSSAKDFFHAHIGLTFKGVQIATVEDESNIEPSVLYEVEEREKSILVYIPRLEKEGHLNYSSNYT
jgi:hypothetical protein